MKRNVSIEEISDGKLYEANDMVKVGCNDCKDCSSCCQGMGSSIILDPYDIYRISKKIETSFEGLMAGNIELNVVDGIILPNLKMSEATGECNFLNKEGRCSIHSFRPGICRLFPLGRVYENGGFKYFLQVNECKKNNRTKVKVSKWLDTPELKKYEKFVTDWHYFLNDLEEVVKNTQDENLIKSINMNMIKNFYMNPFDKTDDFYAQFYEVLGVAKLNIIRKVPDEKI